MAIGAIIFSLPIALFSTFWVSVFHGYDATEPSMAGLLVARGRGVLVGAELGRVSSLAIAPTVLELLGLPVPSQMKEPPISALMIGVAE